VKLSFKKKHVLPEIISNTSPLQYLHQLELLNVFRDLVGGLIVPPAVVAELNEGRALGLNLPDLNLLPWVTIRSPISKKAVPLVANLGPGEVEALMLALEEPEAVLVLDDALARRVARTLGLRFTGTLGLLLDAKSAGLIPAVAPLLDQLQDLRFHLSPSTRAAVMNTAKENPLL
jgi:predicted nucleic acid-binding protein